MHADSPAKAKIFQHGRSQAVRLPKEFRFEGTEVFVRKVGDEVILSSKPRPSMRALVESLDEFEADVQLQRSQPGRPDVRETIKPRRSR
jgi:antitoxin VapB